MNQPAKPRIFIGSSSEGIRAAEMIAGRLNDDFRCYLWTLGLFTPGTHPMEVLEQQAKQQDFGIFVCTPDDLVIKRKEKLHAMRDNISLELGLFMGALGRHRAFMVVPTDPEVKLSTPSDLIGLTQVRYDGVRFRLGGADGMNAMQSAIIELRTAIEHGWIRLQGERRRLTQRMLADRRHTAIRRVYTFIVQLRDLIIVFPGQLFNSMSDPGRFEQVKKQAADAVNRLSDAFREDASSANLVPELDSLVGATRLALLNFPFPIDPQLANLPATEVAIKYAVEAASKLLTQKDPLKNLGQTIETEVEKQIATLVERYNRWWKESHGAIEAATTRLQDALTTATIELNGRLLAEYSS